MFHVTTFFLPFLDFCKNVQYVGQLFLNYLYSESYRKDIGMFRAFAINSRCTRFGTCLPVSKLCRVDLLIPVSAAKSRNDVPWALLACHIKIFIYLSISKD